MAQLLGALVEDVDATPGTHIAWLTTARNFNCSGSDSCMNTYVQTIFFLKEST